MKKYNVAIVGATGLVGQEFIKILEQRKFPMSSIHLYASDRSAGKKMYVNHEEVEVLETSSHSFEHVDIAFVIFQNILPIINSIGVFWQEYPPGFCAIYLVQFFQFFCILFCL